MRTTGIDESVQFHISKGLQGNQKASPHLSDSADILNSKGVVVKSPVRTAVAARQTGNCFVWRPAGGLCHQW